MPGEGRVGVVLAGAVALALALCAPAGATNFSVDSSADAPDASPDDGVCATAALTCTLRAAVEQANAHGGTDGVSVPPGTFELSDGTLDISDPLTITGAGAGSTTVRGSGTDGVLSIGDAGTVTLESLAITDGIHQDGSAIEAVGDALSQLTLQSVRVYGNASGNEAASGAGTIHVFPSGAVTVDVLDSTIEQNADGGDGETGAGILRVSSQSAAASLHIARSRIADNTVGGGGPSAGGNAAVDFDSLSGGEMTVVDSTFQHNVAGADGGGSTGGAIRFHPDSETTASLEILRSSFLDNAAGPDGDGSGGAILFSADGSTLSVDSSTFAGNLAGGGFGGAIDFSGSGFVATNSTFSGNTVIGAGFGGALALEFGDVTLATSTVAGNSVDSGSTGGAIDLNDSSSLTLDNSIVARNRVGGTLRSCNTSANSFEGTNVLDEDSCAQVTRAAREIIFDHPLLGPLQDNGGPTMTRALRPGSPAIDSSFGCADIDQRGISRPRGAACDAGAFEADPPGLSSVGVAGLTSSAATLTGAVDPNGGPTSYHFELGTTALYGSSTPVHDAGSGDDPVTVPASLEGLAPATTYHYRLVATNASGTAASPDATFTTSPAPGPGTRAAGPGSGPVEGSSNVIGPVYGTVRIKLPGSSTYVPLGTVKLIPVGSRIDARRGRVRLTSATDALGHTQTAEFFEGIFDVFQAPGKALTTLTLVGGRLYRCGGGGGGGGASAAAGAAAKRKRPERHLFGDGKGAFRTVGRNAAATVRGTLWRTADTCAGTKIGVRRGFVDVKARGRRRPIRIRAGHTVLVPDSGALIRGRTIKLP